MDNISSDSRLRVGLRSLIFMHCDIYNSLRLVALFSKACVEELLIELSVKYNSSSDSKLREVRFVSPIFVHWFKFNFLSWVALASSACKEGPLIGLCINNNSSSDSR